MKRLCRGGLSPPKYHRGFVPGGGSRPKGLGHSGWAAGGFLPPLCEVFARTFLSPSPSLSSLLSPSKNNRRVGVEKAGSKEQPVHRDLALRSKLGACSRSEAGLSPRLALSQHQLLLQQQRNSEKNSESPSLRPQQWGSSRNGGRAAKPDDIDVPGLPAWGEDDDGAASPPVLWTHRVPPWGPPSSSRGGGSGRGSSSSLPISSLDLAPQLGFVVALSSGEPLRLRSGSWG